MPEEDPRVDPRFLLASERTFLAWSRTALGLVAGGVAVTQLFEAGSSALPPRVLGFALIVTGGAVAYLSYARRRAVERALDCGEPLPPSRLPLFLMLVVVATAAAAVAVTALAE